MALDYLPPEKVDQIFNDLQDNYRQMFGIICSYHHHDIGYGLPLLRQKLGELLTPAEITRPKECISTLSELVGKIEQKRKLNGDSNNDPTSSSSSSSSQQKFSTWLKTIRPEVYGAIRAWEERRYSDSGWVEVSSDAETENAFALLYVPGIFPREKFKQLAELVALDARQKAGTSSEREYFNKVNSSLKNLMYKASRIEFLLSIEHEGLVYAAVRQFFHRINDDLLQEARKCLVEAIYKYDPRGAAKFSTFAFTQISLSLRSAIKSNLPLRYTKGFYRTFSLDLLLGDNDDPGAENKLGSETLVDQDTIPALGALILQSDHQRIHDFLSTKLTDREKEVIQEYDLADDGEGKTFEQIGSEMGCSYETIRKIRAKALVRLRRSLSSG